MTGDTWVPVTTITSDPVIAVTDPGGLEERDFGQTKTDRPGAGRRTREVEQVTDKEITPKEPEKAKDQKSEDKAATRVSRVRRVRRLRRMKK